MTLEILALGLLCVLVVLAVVLGSAKLAQRPDRDQTRQPNALLSDKRDGRFHCSACTARGQSTTFEDASSLLVHEIYDHPRHGWNA